MLDIQKISLIVTGNRQLMNLQKTIKKKLPFQFADIEGYRKISFHEWSADSVALSLEQMISRTTDVIFLTSLLTSLDFDSKLRLWSRYNAEMRRYYRKTLAQSVQIINLTAREEVIVEERFEVERVRPSLRKRRAYP